MKTKILSICFSLIYLLSGCEDFSEEYGFYMDFATDISVTDVRAAHDSYTLDLLCPFEIKAGSPNIQEVGVIYSTDDSYVSHKVKGELLDNCIKVTLSEIPYGQTLHIAPYLRAPEDEVTGRPSLDIKYDKNDFMPSASAYLLSMPTTGKLRMEVDCNVKDSQFPLTKAQASFNGITSDASISQNKLTFDFDLAKMNKSTDTKISFSVSNALGTTNWTVPMTATSATATVHYTDDGCYDDYIRLCSVNWAKGNLICDKGTWKIASRQDESFLDRDKNIVSTTQIEYFSFGGTGSRVFRPEDWYTHAFEQNVDCSIQGDPASDVVAANLSGGWTLPSKSDLEKLAGTSSYQYGYTERDGKITYGVLFYTHPEKIIHSLTSVRFESEELDEMGLFLPALGYIRSKSSGAGYRDNIYYMSADAYKTDYDPTIIDLTRNPPYVSCGNIYHLQQHENNLVVSSDELNTRTEASSCQYQFPVRPIKGIVKENLYNRKLSITKGEVIDLGLSVKWASCNAGAQTPEDLGVTYYLSSAGIGGFDNTKWRVPSREEMQELIESCEWIWGIYNGVNGFQVKGPNGNSIFLPALYIKNQIGMYRVGNTGYGSGNKTIDFLGISSLNHMLKNYNTYDVQIISYKYCIRNVALE